jgi:hypothetical protein
MPVVVVPLMEAMRAPARMPRRAAGVPSQAGERAPLLLPHGAERLDVEVVGMGVQGAQHAIDGTFHQFLRLSLVIVIVLDHLQNGGEGADEVLIFPCLGVGLVGKGRAGQGTDDENSSHEGG